MTSTDGAGRTGGTGGTGGTSGRGRVLCYVSLGDRFDAVTSWIGDAATVADVAVVHYGSAELPGSVRSSARYLLANRDYKLPNFVRLLDETPGLLEGRPGVFFVDDDIVFPPGTLPRFLDIVQRRGLHWAQPAILPDGDVHFPHLAARPGRELVAHDFLEIAVFYLERRFLQEVLPIVRRLHTGFGLDLALMHELARTGRRAAVVHATPVHHPHRPPAETVRGQVPDFDERNARILEMLRAELGAPIGVETIDAIQLMARWFGRVRYRWLRPIQVVWPTLAAIARVTGVKRLGLDRRLQRRRQAG